MFKNKRKEEILRALSKNLRPDYTQTNRDTGIAIATLYDNWKKNKIEIIVKVNGTELEDGKT